MSLLEQKTTPPSLSIFVVALILSVLSAIFYTYPKYKSWQQSKAAATEQQAQLDSLQDQSSRVNTSLNKIKQNVTSLSLVNAAIPDSPSIPDLYAHLEQLVKASNLSLASVQAAEAVADNIPQSVVDSQAAADPNASSAAPSPTLGVIEINMDVKGSVSNFDSFLTSLEKSLRFLEVQNVSVSGSDNANAANGGDLSFRLQITTYYEK